MRKKTLNKTNSHDKNTKNQHGVTVRDYSPSYGRLRKEDHLSQEFKTKWAIQDLIHFKQQKLTKKNFVFVFK